MMTPPTESGSTGRGACAAAEARANGEVSPTSPYSHVRIPGTLWATDVFWRATRIRQNPAHSTLPQCWKHSLSKPCVRLGGKYPPPQVAGPCTPRAAFSRRCAA